MSTAQPSREPDSGAAEVVRRCREAGASIATAESLTGGLVCAELTSIPGASAVVRGGIIAYLPEVKHSALGVPEELIATDGVVSSACAAAMARGARNRLEATWAVATTGVAGPDPSEGHPPGTVFVAVAGPASASALTGREQVVRVVALSLHGSREEIRAATVAAAIRLLGDALSG